MLSLLIVFEPRNHPLAPVRPGANVVRRSSIATPLTVDPDAWFSNPDADSEAEDGVNEGRRLRAKCRCGWRQHMLVPRGTHQGMHATLFAMATPSEDLVRKGNKLRAWVQILHPRFFLKGHRKPRG